MGTFRLESQKKWNILLIGLVGQSTEGKEFALVPPERGVTGPTDVMFVASEYDANVEVTGYDGFHESFLVPAYSTHIMVMDWTWFVDSPGGVETVVLYAESDAPIRVSYCKTDITSASNADASIVYPVPQGGSPYVSLISGTHYTLSYMLGGFYSVGAYMDDTNVEIFLQENNARGNHKAPQKTSITLNRYEVYTYYAGQNWDTVGLVTSDQPVAVTCGHFRSRIYHNYDFSFNSQYPFEAMPPTENLGTQYVTVPIGFGRPEPGYVIRITALEDGTVVRLPEFNVEMVLNSTEHQDYDGQNIVPSPSAILVTCSSKCLVTQYAKEVKTGSEEFGRPMAMAMVALTPQSLYTSSLFFSPPQLVERNGWGILAITVATRQVGDLWLNTTNLKDHPSWKMPENEEYNFSYIMLSIEWGTYHLHTSDPNSNFAAYVYVVESSLRGAAINLGYGGEFKDSLKGKSQPLPPQP